MDVSWGNQPVHLRLAVGERMHMAVAATLRPVIVMKLFSRGIRTSSRARGCIKASKIRRARSAAFKPTVKVPAPNSTTMNMTGTARTVCDGPSLSSGLPS